MLKSASLGKLKGVSDPEAKRKAIGNTFIEVFDEEATKITDVKWLAQGTIYPDVIESAGSKTGKAHVIKSHHNVGGLPDDMALELVEPLRELFKDEVRRIGLDWACPKAWSFVIRSRARSRCAHFGRGQKRIRRFIASGRRDFYGRIASVGVVRKNQSGLCGVSAREVGRCGGGWSPLRVGDCYSSGADHRFHDRALGAPAL